MHTKFACKFVNTFKSHYMLFPCCYQGYHTRKGFIIAQSPMKNTTRDFFKMIVDYEVSVIVMCCDLQETGEV